MCNRYSHVTLISIYNLLYTDKESISVCIHVCLVLLTVVGYSMTKSLLLFYLMTSHLIPLQSDVLWLGTTDSVHLMYTWTPEIFHQYCFYMSIVVDSSRLQHDKKSLLVYLMTSHLFPLQSNVVWLETT